MRTFWKLASSSSGCETHPVKAEPGGPVASLAAEVVTPGRCVGKQMCGLCVGSSEKSHVPVVQGVDTPEDSTASSVNG